MKDIKETTNRLKDSIKKEVESLPYQIKLAVIRVGQNLASEVYVRNKKRDCEECGIICEEFHLKEAVNTADVLSLIEKLNRDKAVNGILVQLPLPRQIDEEAILSSININKDVDCFSPTNVGKLYQGHPFFTPCTPTGIINYLELNDFSFEGSNCVVIGRSNIVGKPMAQMLLQKNATVTLCHSKTKELSSFTKKADLIICAVGRSNFLTGDMIKEGAIVIDVGINRNNAGKLCGDVDYKNVIQKAGFVTPVPGGVGLLTRVSLLQNIIKAAEFQNLKKS